SLLRPPLRYGNGIVWYLTVATTEISLTSLSVAAIFFSQISLRCSSSQPLHLSISISVLRFCSLWSPVGQPRRPVTLWYFSPLTCYLFYWQQYLVLWLFSLFWAF